MFTFGFVAAKVFKGRLVKMYFYVCSFTIVLQFAAMVALFFYGDDERAKYSLFILSLVNIVLSFFLMSITSSGLAISISKLELLMKGRKVFA